MSPLAQRLLIVSGKGGVGKSAVTAAVAASAHRAGMSVLAIDVAGSGGLAAHFGIGSLAFAPRELRPGLHAMSIDRSKALIEYLQVQAGLPAILTLAPAARAFDALAGAAPGVREIVTLGKVLWETRSRRYDLVVADCLPTGQVTGLLRAPSTIAELVPTGRIRQQAEWMRDLLLDPVATQLVLVTLAEELPVVETEETLAYLLDEKLVGNLQIVANRVLPELRTATTGSGEVAEAAALHRALYAEQQEWLERLPPDRTLPYLFGLLTPGEVAARLADAWAGP